MSNLTAAQELLRDSFTRLIEHVDELTDGLTEEVASYRPTSQANSIGWLIWHSARVQDIQVCDIAKTLADGRSDKPRSEDDGRSDKPRSEDVWTRDGWVDRFGLDLPRDDTGYGHSADAVAKVRASVELLAGYYHAVHDMTLEFVETLTDADLERIVDRRWDPPVTASARLVSIVDDCAQHLGQAAYLRGIA
jgi:DinB superfamily